MFRELCLIRAAKYVDIFMFDHFYEFIPCRPQILCGVKLSRFFSENWRIMAVMARRPSLSMLILHTAERAARRSCTCRYTHRTFQFAPVAIDQVHMFGRYRRCAMQYDGIARKTLFRSLPEYRSAEKGLLPQV